MHQPTLQKEETIKIFLLEKPYIGQKAIRKQSRHAGALNIILKDLGQNDQVLPEFKAKVNNSSLLERVHSLSIVRCIHVQSEFIMLL